MQHDCDQRAQHQARFCIAPENYQTEKSFAQSWLDTAHAFLDMAHCEIYVDNCVKMGKP